MSSLWHKHFMPCCMQAHGSDDSMHSNIQRCQAQTICRYMADVHQYDKVSQLFWILIENSDVDIVAAVETYLRVLLSNNIFPWHSCLNTMIGFRSPFTRHTMTDGIWLIEICGARAKMTLCVLYYKIIILFTNHRSNIGLPQPQGVVLSTHYINIYIYI